jgi:hypothetical protein
MEFALLNYLAENKNKPYQEANFSIRYGASKMK